MKEKLLILIMLLSTLVFARVIEEDESLADDGAKYCRCRPYSLGDEKWCLAGNAISFRPICVEGGGDCWSGNGNCQ